MKIGNFELNLRKIDENSPNFDKIGQNAQLHMFNKDDQNQWIGQEGWSEHDPNVPVLDDMIMSQCLEQNGDCIKSMQNNTKMKYSIEYLVNNLPSITTVANMYTQLIVGGGLVADTADGNAKLQKWLQQKPLTSMTHQEIINDAIENSVIYGYTGLRDLGGGRGIIPVHPQHFKIWKMPYTIHGKPVPGVKDEFLYEVWDEAKSLDDKGGSKILIDEKEYTLAEVVKNNMFKKAPDGSFYPDDGMNGAGTKTVYVPKNNFCHLRHNLYGDYGESILSRDRLRLGMMIDLILNMNDEINNDGNDYTLWLKGQNPVGGSLSQMMSNSSANASVLGNMDSKATKSLAEKSIESAKQLARKMRRSNKTRINIMREDVISKFERVDGTARLIDYYPFLSDATTIIANAFGLHPILAGSTSSGWNTSMSSVIQFTLEKIIVPFQRMYSTQIESYVQKSAGIKGGIKFKEYDLSDKKAIADIEETISRTKKNLAQEQEILNNIKVINKESSDGNTKSNTTTKRSRSDNREG